MTNTVASGANSSAARNSSDSAMKSQRTSVLLIDVAARPRGDVFESRGVWDRCHQRADWT